MSETLEIQNLTKGEELVCNSVTVLEDVFTESLIDANKLFVEGTTHEGSTQYVKYATIFTHRGLLRCHKANIKLLDGGEVHASYVKVDTCKSGSIYAQDIVIKDLENDASINASNSIEIESISGQNNTLIIDYKSVPILVSKLELINEDIEELEFLLSKAQKDNLATEQSIKEEIQTLNNELEKIKHSSKNAKISIKKSIEHKNTIIFTLENDKEIIYTSENKIYAPFYLQYSENEISLHPTKVSIPL